MTGTTLFGWDAATWRRAKTWASSVKPDILEYDVDALLSSTTPVATFVGMPLPNAVAIRDLWLGCGGLVCGPTGSFDLE